MGVMISGFYNFTKLKDGQIFTIHVTAQQGVVADAQIARAAELVVGMWYHP